MPWLKLPPTPQVWTMQTYTRSKQAGPCSSPVTRRLLLFENIYYTADQFRTIRFDHGGTATSTIPGLAALFPGIQTNIANT